MVQKKKIEATNIEKCRNGVLQASKNGERDEERASSPQKNFINSVDYPHRINPIPKAESGSINYKKNKRKKNISAHHLLRKSRQKALSPAYVNRSSKPVAPTSLSPDPCGFSKGLSSIKTLWVIFTFPFPSSNPHAP
jgi:hypothetical protein